MGPGNSVDTFAAEAGSITGNFEKLSDGEVTRLLGEIGEGTKAGNAKAYLVGCRLLAERDEARMHRGGIAHWVRSQPHGLPKSTLYLFMGVARGIRDQSNALDSSILEHPLRDIPRLIRQATGASGTVKPAKAKDPIARLDAQGERLLAAVRAAPQPEEALHWFLWFMVASAKKLDLVPRLTDALGPVTSAAAETPASMDGCVRGDPGVSIDLVMKVLDGDDAAPHGGLDGTQHATGPTVDPEWDLELLADQVGEVQEFEPELDVLIDGECHKFLVPFRSSDVARAVNCSHQKVTRELLRLRWPYSKRALLRDGRRGPRWLPQGVDLNLVDFRFGPPTCWTDLHEDDRKATWEVWHHQVR